MSSQPLQGLNIYLRGGQKINVLFNVSDPKVLNPQIAEFLKALGDKTKKDGIYVFQGSRLVSVRLNDVSACEVDSLVATRTDEEKKEPKKEEKKPGTK